MTTLESGPWTLAVDIGSGTTTAAISRNGQLQGVGEDGVGQFLSIPSAVACTERGEIVAGDLAQREAVFAPERAERSPKPSVGEQPVLLSDHAVPVASLLAALLRRVLTEARETQSDGELGELRLTHPAHWGPARLEVLSEAARMAGIPTTTFVAEPIAAAEHVARTKIREGQYVAICDLGAGSLDIAVLHRSADGFQLAGPPGSWDAFGGDAIDHQLVTLLGHGPLGRHPGWRDLCAPRDEAGRSQAESFIVEVRRAKEALSTAIAVELKVPALELEVQVTKQELNDVVAPLLDSSLDCFAETVAECGVAMDDLAAVVLVGGSSRIPLVADALWRRFGVRPEVIEQPAGAVVLGAASGLTGSRTGVTFRSRVAVAPAINLWNKGGASYGYLEVAGDGATVLFSDEPARGRDTAAMADSLGEHLSSEASGYQEIEAAALEVFGRPDGIERRYLLTAADGPELWFDRYLHLEDRWLMVRSPERAREIVNRTAFEQPQDGASSRFAIRFLLDVPDTWTVSERLEFIRNETNQRVTAQSFSIPAGSSPGEWISEHADSFTGYEGYVLLDRRPGKILGRNAADVLFLRDPANSQVIRLALGVIEDRGYRVLVTLPENPRNVTLVPNHSLIATHMVMRDSTTFVPVLPPLPSLAGLKRRFGQR